MQVDVTYDENELRDGFNVEVILATNGDSVIMHCSPNCEAEEFRAFASALIVNLLKEKYDTGYDRFTDISEALHEITSEALERFMEEI